MESLFKHMLHETQPLGGTLMEMIFWRSEYGIRIIICQQKISNDSRSKGSMHIKIAIRFVTVNYNEFACGEKVVRCVNMA
jgi:hypothetical protein